MVDYTQLANIATLNREDNQFIDDLLSTLKQIYVTAGIIACNGKGIISSATAGDSYPPYIGQNGHWYVYDYVSGDFIDSGIAAGTSINIGTVTTLEPGSDAYVTNSGTSSEATLNFGIPKGDKGATGMGPFHFSINEEGHLLVSYADSEHPDFYIGNDGHLYLGLD